MGQIPSSSFGSLKKLTYLDWMVVVWLVQYHLNWSSMRVQHCCLLTIISLVYLFVRLEFFFWEETKSLISSLYHGACAQKSPIEVCNLLVEQVHDSLFSNLFYSVVSYSAFSLTCLQSIVFPFLRTNGQFSVHWRALE